MVADIIIRYHGFKTKKELLEHKSKIKYKKYLGSGWNKRNKFFYDIEPTKKLKIKDLM